MEILGQYVAVWFLEGANGKYVLAGFDAGLCRASHVRPVGLDAYFDLAELVRVQFDKRVSIFVGRFDHALNGHMMNPIAHGVAAGVVVAREPRDHAARVVQRLQQRLGLGHPMVAGGLLEQGEVVNTVHNHAGHSR